MHQQRQLISLKPSISLASALYLYPMKRKMNLRTLSCFIASRCRSSQRVSTPLIRQDVPACMQMSTNTEHAGSNLSQSSTLHRNSGGEHFNHKSKDHSLSSHYPQFFCWRAVQCMHYHTPAFHTTCHYAPKMRDK